jgi:hypothetical protein
MGLYSFLSKELIKFLLVKNATKACNMKNKMPWTKFSSQEERWTEFSTLEDVASLPCSS